MFAAQIQLANERDLPLVIHSRSAWDETFEILDREGTPRTVMHCFTGGPDEAHESLARGAIVSFAGIITFRADRPPRRAAVTPLDRLLVETDSPYLAPVPNRGKRTSRMGRPCWRGRGRSEGITLAEVEAATGRPLQPSTTSTPLARKAAS